MNSTSKPCPDQQTLLQFIQGRLEPPTLDQCENHVSDCQSCHETLRGLDVNDTLSHYVSEALEHSPTENVSDSQAIDGLMHRLLEPSNLRKHGRRPTKIDSEIMADRAAEVLRCIDPPAIGDDDSLGTLGDYRLLRLIGAGGSGVVFQARDISLDRLVALKVLRPSLGEIARDRFIAEARLAASIEHDNVVTIYQIGQQDRLAFIAMQWVPGETLESRLGRESEVADEVTVREFVSQIASGLSAAHKRQLIHRDIKPANIWICEDTNRIKILDFGLARIADEESGLTQTGMLAGTPSFMSPEQARGMELDPRSDLFSLGCVMYLLLTGRLPFSAPTVLGTLQTIQSDSPQPPIALNSDCDNDLSDLTMSLLEKLPGNRLASADNLISSLNNPRPQWPQKVAVTSNVAPSISGKAPAASPATTRSSIGFRWLIATAVLGILGVTGWLMAPQVLRIVTDQGELVVETEDPNIKIEVRENGGHVQILDLSSNESFDIRSGNYEFSATKEGSNTEFEVTPKSVKMTRGGRELVSVTIRKMDLTKTLSIHEETGKPESSIPLPTNRKSMESLLSTAMMFQRNEFNKLHDQFGNNHPAVLSARTRLSKISEQYHALNAIASDIEKLKKKPKLDGALGGESESSSSLDDIDSPEKLRAAIAAMKVQRDQLAESLGAEHPSTQSIESKIASTEKHFAYLNSNDNAPIYGGRNFEQWIRIAMNDREPQAVSDAIAACGVLAEGEQKNLFLKQLRKLARMHGTAFGQEVTNGGALNTANIYITGFLKALDQLEIDEVVDFIQVEMDAGNERSLGFCSRIFSYLDFDDDVTKTTEFFNTVALDTNPLMKRIYQRDIKVDFEVISFLNSCFTRSKADADVATCLKTVLSLDAAERPELYRTLLLRFCNGELNDAIIADFFADSISGSTRESYIPSILHAGKIAYSFVPVSKNRKSLTAQILTEAITRVLNPDAPELEFDSYREIWFDQDRLIETFKDKGGNIMWTKTDGSGTLVETKPEGAKQIRGQAAIVRHLLTKLCQAVGAETLEDKDRELVLNFVKLATGSENEAINDLIDSPDFQELLIEKDLKNLRDVANGEKKEDPFTRFAKEQKRFFGGGGGGGFGGGGGGGVF